MLLTRAGLSSRVALSTFVLALVVCVLLVPTAARADFGVVPGSVNVRAMERNGTTDIRAGSHPYVFEVGFEFNRKPGNEGPEGSARDIEVDLPPGLVGNPRAVARCSRQDFDTNLETFCPGNTQVGVLVANVNRTPIEAPVFNLVPPPGVLARIGVQADGLSAIEDAAVRAGQGYGVAVTAHNIPTPKIESISERIWGVPYDSGHDPERRCLTPKGLIVGCSLGGEALAKPFLTLPVSCNGPLSLTVKADSTETPGAFPENALSETGLLRDSSQNPVGMSGCERLSFEPSLTVVPQTADGAPRTEDPAGLNVDLKVPQPETPEGLNEANLREAVVRLPAGMTVSPSAANGLQVCSLEQVGLSSSAPASCPEASKVASVEVTAPALDHPLQGSVFLAQQGNVLGAGSNPFGSLLAMYLVAEGEGVVAKVPGEIQLSESGQVTARFGPDPLTGEAGLPPLPYSELKMSFFTGPRAALMTPSACGTYTTTAELTPYGNDPAVGPVSPAVSSSSSFQVSQGCSPGFTPSIVAGATNSQAGAFTTGSFLLTRPDGQQQLERVRFTGPPGFAGVLAGVQQCTEAQAQADACPEASRVAHNIIEAGPGSDPVVIPQPGQPEAPDYLTGPYEGAPFGFLAKVPLHVGPFQLPTQVVRGRIEVDPRTAQVTVTSDPLPQIVEGIPTDVRSVHVLIDRPKFVFNPTNCDPFSFNGTVTSTAATTVSLSTPFQATGCASLPFAPKLTANVPGKGSRQNGTAFNVKVTSAGLGQAGIAKVLLTIPKALPSRLTTIQKACRDSIFEANPASCDEGSMIGTATIHTPLLANPLSGTGYLVSHGGAAFPDVEFVLHGEGITVILDGKTDIKHGITYSRFESVPDAPFTTFEANLPAGPHSALGVNTLIAKNYNLCNPTTTTTVTKHLTIRRHGKRIKVTRHVAKETPTPLVMPTTIVGQNGATITQTTKINASGCPTTKAKGAHTTSRHKPHR